MRNTIYSGLLTLAGILSLGGQVTSAHAQGPALEFSNGYRTVLAGSNASLGWKFTVTSQITVVALDAYADHSGNPPGSVRLYDASNVLASAALNTSDTQEGSPVPFYSAPVTPVVLLPGDYYIAEDIIGWYGGDTGTDYITGANGLTTNPDIVYTGPVGSLGLGQNPTSNADFANYTGEYYPLYFGPDFDIRAAPPSRTPEPGSLALFAAGGMCALGTVIRKRRSAR